MILDTRYINNNFNTVNKLNKLIGYSDSLTQLNTKYHTVFTEEDRKNYKKNYLMYLLFTFLFFGYGYFMIVSNESSIYFKIGIGFAIIIGMLLQGFLYYVTTLGNSTEFKPYKIQVPTKQFFKYYSIKLPLETLPDWMTDDSVVYDKETYMNVVNKFNEPNIYNMISKYKRLALKTNNIIANNKKILNSWLKEEHEALIITSNSPYTIINYHEILSKQGFTEEEIEEYYNDKLLYLSGKKK